MDLWKGELGDGVCSGGGSGGGLEGRDTIYCDSLA